MTAGRAHASGARTGSTFGPSVIARAQGLLTIEAYLAGESVKLHGSDRDRRGPCILCDGGTTKFSVKGDRWRCFGCDRFGDVVDLVAAHRRMSLGEAARWICGEDAPHGSDGPRPSRPMASGALPTRREQGGPSPSDKVALEIWAGVKPIGGTLAERYLLGRGVPAELVELAGANLRFHPSAKVRWDPGSGAWVRAPAMVVQVVVPGPDGAPVPTGGVHVTYLDRQTGGKAVFRTPEGLLPAKRMWGPQRLNGLSGGAWLIGPAGIGALTVAEGIETALSVAALAERSGRPLRACAALSLNRLQGGWLRDDEGCVDLTDIRGDPDAPAFAWPLPKVGAWNEVTVAVDRDMSPVKVRARTGRGRACDFILGPEERARVCGRLAVAAWKATGAARVRAIAPPPGSDFNDELRRVLALGGGDA